jgi:predicted small metal-binding protein
MPWLLGVRFLPARMGKEQDGVVMVVSCACGVVMRGREDELVPMVQKHARESHNMNPTREDVLSRARPES